MEEKAKYPRSRRALGSLPSSPTSLLPAESAQLVRPKSPPRPPKQPKPFTSPRLAPPTQCNKSVLENPSGRLLNFLFPQGGGPSSRRPHALSASNGDAAASSSKPPRREQASNAPAPSSAPPPRGAVAPQSAYSEEEDETSTSRPPPRRELAPAIPFSAPPPRGLDAAAPLDLDGEVVSGDGGAAPYQATSLRRTTVLEFNFRAQQGTAGKRGAEKEAPSWTMPAWAAAAAPPPVEEDFGSRVALDGDSSWTIFDPRRPALPQSTAASAQPVQFLQLSSKPQAASPPVAGAPSPNVLVASAPTASLANALPPHRRVVELSLGTGKPSVESLYAPPVSPRPAAPPPDPFKWTLRSPLTAPANAFHDLFTPNK